MDHIITLDEPHLLRALQKSRAMGMTLDHYVQLLIDADSRGSTKFSRPFVADSIR